MLGSEFFPCGTVQKRRRGTAVGEELTASSSDSHLFLLRLLRRGGVRKNPGSGIKHHCSSLREGEEENNRRCLPKHE